MFFFTIYVNFIPISYRLFYFCNMSFIKEFSSAIYCYAEAFRFIAKHKLQGLFVLAVILYLILIACSGFLIWSIQDHFYANIENLSFYKKTVTWLNSFSWLLQIIKYAFFISCMMLFLSIYKFVYLIIASPLYAYISEKTAESKHGTHVKFSLSRFISDVKRGVYISGMNAFRQLFFTLLLFLLSMIPVVGILFTLLILCLDCYYYGFSMLDYNCERHQMSVRESRNFIFAHKGAALGNGFILYLSLLIPFIGVIFVAPLSVIASTLHFYKLIQIDNGLTPHS